MCAAADNGSMSSSETCVETCCATTYCSAGSAVFFQAIATCICASSLCGGKSECGDSGDYCSNPGTIATQACETCLEKYTATGKTCDPSSGTINSTCSASADCTNYLACANGCP